MRVFNGISFETGARTHKYFKPRGGKYSARKKRQMGAILVNMHTIILLYNALYANLQTNWNYKYNKQKPILTGRDQSSFSNINSQGSFLVMWVFRKDDN